MCVVVVEERKGDAAMACKEEIHRLEVARDHEEDAHQGFTSTLL